MGQLREAAAPGGVRAVTAEFLMLRHQLLMSNRSRQRAPNLTSIDRFVPGLTTLFVSPCRIPTLGALIKPATLFKFHKALLDRKWSIDRFRCESLLLRSHWVMLVMDIFTRRIVGFGVERLIGTIRREYLDRVFFWNAVDLARKLGEFRDYYNAHSVHRSLDGTTPPQRAGASAPAPGFLDRHPWGNIAEVCFRRPLPLDWEFATHTCETDVTSSDRRA